MTSSMHPTAWRELTASQSSPFKRVFVCPDYELLHQRGKLPHIETQKATWAVLLPDRFIVSFIPEYELKLKLIAYSYVYGTTLWRPGSMSATTWTPFPITIMPNWKVFIANKKHVPTYLLSPADMYRQCRWRQILDHSRRWLPRQWCSRTSGHQRERGRSTGL